jgi:polyisoprenoid-binding protein YceI
MCQVRARRRPLLGHTGAILELSAAVVSSAGHGVRAASDVVVHRPRWNGHGRPRMGIWQLDPLHTQVEFAVKHLGMMTVRGHFADVQTSGDINVERPEASSIEVVIQTASIRTHNERRDNDLRNSNILDVEHYPTITFKSTKVEITTPNHYSLTGDLTIKATTRPVALTVVNYGEFNDPMMGHRIGYGAETQILRKDFGLNVDMLLDGRLVIGNEVLITIQGEVLESAETKAGAAK